MSFAHPKALIRKVERRHGCMQAALCILGDKWSPLLLGQLAEGPKTFGQLEISLSAISPRTLSARLDKLLEAGVIQKWQYNAHPPRYKYELTKKGKELLGILRAMSDWGNKYHTLS